MSLVYFYVLFGVSLLDLRLLWSKSRRFHSVKSDLYKKFITAGVRRTNLDGRTNLSRRAENVSLVVLLLHPLWIWVYVFISYLSFLSLVIIRILYICKLLKVIDFLWFNLYIESFIVFLNSLKKLFSLKKNQYVNFYTNNHINVLIFYTKVYKFLYWVCLIYCIIKLIFDITKPTIASKWKNVGWASSLPFFHVLYGFHLRRKLVRHR